MGGRCSSKKNNVNEIAKNDGRGKELIEAQGPQSRFRYRIYLASRRGLRSILIILIPNLIFHTLYSHPLPLCLFTNSLFGSCFVLSIHAATIQFYACLLYTVSYSLLLVAFLFSLFIATHRHAQTSTHYCSWFW